MKIAVEAIFDSSDIEQAIMMFDMDYTLFTDIIDFMNNHKSDEYVSLSVDSDYVSVSAGRYHTIRRHTSLPDIITKSYSTNTVTPKKPFPTLQNAKIYANRNSFYFYGDCDGVLYQSHDITKDTVNQWCMEVINV
jgi:hypothetical protein